MSGDNEAGFGSSTKFEEKEKLLDKKEESKIDVRDGIPRKTEPEEGCSILKVLHYIGLVLLMGYFGYSLGMLVGFSRKDASALRVNLTYILMMLLSFTLFLGELRLSVVISRLNLFSTPFGLAISYAFLGVFALLDDEHWWKWCLFSPMVALGVCYIIGASCSVNTLDPKSQ
mmetsp:Transcript_16090/g.24258  ORF Transcript_16090/g.24258 Transcript_16090/m.24258 type:complete len:172 (+) Transcript_16090:76-591(+)